MYITIKNNEITISKQYFAKLQYSTSSLYTRTNWAGQKCLAGQFDITENLNGSSRNLSKLPVFTLNSTDGLVSYWVYSEKKSNGQFYFDVILDNVDLSKSYTFSIKSGDTNNTYPAETLNIKDGFLTIGDLYITIKSNQINISNEYNAELFYEPANLYFRTNWKGDTCLAGDLTLYLKETQTGNTINLTTLPIIELYSEDKTYIQKAYIEKKNNIYYFDVIIDELDLSKQYYIKLSDSNTNNLSTLKTKNLGIASVTNNLYTYTASVRNSFITLTKTITTGIYGKSGLKFIGDSRGTDLKYYKIGNGPNVLFAVFAMHGYEDLWSKDGYELTIIAEDFVKKLGEAHDSQILNNWTIYVFPQANPDGLNYGYTNDGPGRCTVTGVNGIGVDFNRCWSTDFSPNYNERNYTGPSAFGAYEAQYLRDFLLDNKSKYGQTVLIDLHGWTTQLIGDQGICLNYYGPQFYGSYNNSISKYTSSYGKGYLINWAKTNLSNNYGTAARSALIELPSAGIYNHQSVVNANYSQKYYNATVNMLKDIV